MKGFICCLLVSVAVERLRPSRPLPEADASPAGAVPLADALTSLEPQDVWRNFYALTQVPRPSGHLEQVRAYLVQFGQDLGLETSVDDAGNVLIRKPAAPGMEDRKGVILQAHMDMVPQKTPEKIHDFTTDPIQAYVDGEWVRAAGTTLGADDGLASPSPWPCCSRRRWPPVRLRRCSPSTKKPPCQAEGLNPRAQGELYINLDAEEEARYHRHAAALAGVTAAYASRRPPGMAHAVSVQGERRHSGVDIHRGQRSQTAGAVPQRAGRPMACALPSSRRNAANAIPRGDGSSACPQAKQTHSSRLRSSIRRRFNQLACGRRS